jgi:hypothetical protein
MMDIEAMMRRIGVGTSSAQMTEERQRVAPVAKAKLPPAPPPPPPLSTRAGAVGASVVRTKLDFELDLGEIKQGALMREIQKHGSGTRGFVEPPTNNRVDMLFEIQKKGRVARQVPEPRTDNRSALLIDIQKQQNAARRRIQELVPEPEVEPETQHPEPEAPAKCEQQSRKSKKPAPPPVAHLPADMGQTVNNEVEHQHQREVEELRLENQRLLADLDAARRELSERPKTSGSSSKEATMAAAGDIAKDALRALQALQETSATWSQTISSEGQLEETRQQKEDTGAALTVTSRSAKDNGHARDAAQLGEGHSGTTHPLQVYPRNLCVIFDSPLRERVLMIEWDHSTRPGLAGMSTLLGANSVHLPPFVLKRPFCFDCSKVRVVPLRQCQDCFSHID